jgi:CheY-like chemotaxis protein
MKRVLIVDDKEENVYYLQALLSGHGFEVETARHGAEALVKARKTPPELIVSDLLMPVMDGYTLLRHWKSDAQLRAIPFIVYTATYTEEQDEKLALSLGADAFIFEAGGAGGFPGAHPRGAGGCGGGATGGALRFVGRGAGRAENLQRDADPETGGEVTATGAEQPGAS